jgi:hypothetical protein
MLPYILTSLHSITIFIPSILVPLSSITSPSFCFILSPSPSLSYLTIHYLFHPFNPFNPLTSFIPSFSYIPTPFPSIQSFLFPIPYTFLIPSISPIPGTFSSLQSLPSSHPWHPNNLFHPLTFSFLLSSLFI